MKNPKKLVAPLVVVLVIVLGVYYFAKGPMTPKSATVVNEDGTRTYANNKIGLSFNYPTDWTLGDNSVHGDKDGLPFRNSLASSTNGVIEFFHSPVSGKDGDSYDFISVGAQAEKVACTAALHCEELTNKNGVKYFRFTSCQREGCFISAVVPTGKYMMTFLMSADGLLRAPLREPTFRKLVDSIELI